MDQMQFVCVSHGSVRLWTVALKVLMYRMVTLAMNAV